MSRNIQSAQEEGKRSGKTGQLGTYPPQQCALLSRVLKSSPSRQSTVYTGKAMQGKRCLGVLDVPPAPPRALAAIPGH